MRRTPQQVVANEYGWEKLYAERVAMAYGRRYGMKVRIDKAEQLLGWGLQTQFRDGVSHLVVWYQANREWAKNVSTPHESCNH